MTKNALILGTVLVDGFVRGSWRTEKSGRTTRLVVTPFAALSAREREEVEREGAALLDFLPPRAGDRDVVILPAAGS
nr:crosslink repair DNA glycosylase YcaQ family protein [Streptomyces sp. NRRL F-5065]